jgi:DNA-binding Lrp family transcriptional regulator
LSILRDARNGIGIGAKKTREVVQKLERAGARVVSVKPEALGVLEAISRLLANARSGDLTYKGDSVPAATVEEWLRGALPRAVDELLDEIGGERETARDELAGMLMDLLAKAKVISVEDAASQLGKTVEEVEECGRRNASLVGFAGGSKRVLFRIVERQQAGEPRD